jgi:hypothetical protein
LHRAQSQRYRFTAFGQVRLKNRAEVRLEIFGLKHGGEKSPRADPCNGADPEAE